MPRKNDSIPGSLQTRIDPICDVFEAAWKSGSEPDLAEHVAQLPPNIQEPAAHELLLLDLHYREQRGKQISHEEYLKRYPRLSGALAIVFSENQSDETILTDSAPNQIPPVGDRVRYFGDYEVLGEIARGGMGVVYRAKQVSLNRVIALKMILAGQFADEGQIRRFQIEAESAANLDHPGIVPIYDIGQHEDQHYFSMKLIEGKSLSEHAASLDQLQAVQLVAKIADAVHHAHQRGILHRDLKPSNILIDAEGQPVVTDFGLARQTESNHDLTQTGAVVGTPGFMSPEQASGDLVTTATDIYSLGAILYKLLCGQPPHSKPKVMDTLMSVINEPATKPRKHNPTIDSDLELICLKCLANKPNDRYASAAEFASELRAFADGRPLQVRAPSVIELTRMWLSSNYGSIIWVPIVALISGVLFGVAFWVATTANRYVPAIGIYERIAPSERPWLAMNYNGLRGIGWLICFLSASMIGWATARLVRTKNTSADVGAGLSVGLLAGLIALIVSVGPVIQIRRAGATGDDFGLLQIFTRGDAIQNDQALSNRYPALVDESDDNVVSIISTKYKAELEIGLLKGSWLATSLVVSMFGFMGVYQTLIAGPQIRNQSMWLARVNYGCFTLVMLAVTFVFWSNMLFEFQFGNGYVLDWKRPLSIGLTFLLTLAFVVRRPHVLFPIVSTVVCMFLTYGFFQSYFIGNLNPVRVAQERSNIDAAERSIHAYPEDPGAKVRYVLAKKMLSNQFNDSGWADHPENDMAMAMDLMDTLSQEELDGGRLHIRLADREEHVTYDFARRLAYEQAMVNAILARDMERVIDVWVRATEQFELTNRSISKVATRLVQTDQTESFLALARQRQGSWRVAQALHAATRARERVNGTSAKDFQQWTARMVAATAHEEALLKQLSAWLHGKQTWSLYGPFEFKNGENEKVAIDQPYGPEVDLVSTENEDFAAARTVSIASGVPVNLGEALGKAEGVVGYAHSSFHLEQPQTITFKMGSNDGIKVWIDGEVIHRNLVFRDTHVGDDSVEVPLSSGDHEMVIKIVQGTSSWSFGIEALDQKGWPVFVW